MCLNKVTKKFDTPVPLRDGYKVVNRKNRTVVYLTLLTKRWLKASPRYGSNNLYSNQGDSYEIGFHIFSTKKDATRFSKQVSNSKVVKVEGREIVTEGVGDGFGVNRKNFVARYIRLT